MNANNLPSQRKDGDDFDVASADEIIRAIVRKMEAHKRELARAKLCIIKVRRDKGRIEVDLTPTL